MIIALVTVTTITYSVQADSEPEISFCSYKDTVDYYHNTAYHPGKHKYEGNYNGIGGSITTNSRNIMWGVSSLITDNIAYCEVELNVTSSIKAEMKFSYQSQRRDYRDYFFFMINIFTSDDKKIATTENTEYGSDWDSFTSLCYNFSSETARYAQAGGTYKSVNDGMWYGGAFKFFC